MNLHSLLLLAIVSVSTLGVALTACGSDVVDEGVEGVADGVVDSGAPAADAGPDAPCVVDQDRAACGCCFSGEDVVCPTGVAPPDSAVLTLPVCPS